MSGNKKIVKNQPGIQSFFRPAPPKPKLAPAMATPSSPPDEVSFHTAPSSQQSSPELFQTPLETPPTLTTSRLDPQQPPPAFNAPTTQRSQVSAASQSGGLSQEFPSSLLPPPSTLSPKMTSSVLQIRSPPPKSTPIQPMSSFDREVKGSDDEDSDSDDSLADLSELLKSNHSSGSRASVSHVLSTPVLPRSRAAARRGVKTQPAPPPAIPKYSFDLKSLIDDAAKDEATEAESRRVKEKMAAPTLKSVVGKFPNKLELSKHAELLQTVMGNEEGGAEKLTHALQRTETTLSEYRWYFFDTNSRRRKHASAPFPDMVIPDTWRAELEDPERRYHTFVSGFAEDMVLFGNSKGNGNVLPDEIFMWMMDEVCLDPDEAMRTSYSDVMRQCKEQVKRLVIPQNIERMLKNLGGTSTATDITHKIEPVQELPNPYRTRDWAELRSVLRFLGHVARSLAQSTREYVICMLLRMSADQVIFENVHILDLVHEVICRLTIAIKPDDWDSSCFKICTHLFTMSSTSLQKSVIRLHMVTSISSTTPEMHDLRRRLATSFALNDVTCSNRHSHATMNLERFITRLDSADFSATKNTDYRELAALVSLLDIAVDDGRSSALDLTKPEVEKVFNDNVQVFANAVEAIIRSIGPLSNSSGPKIEAKAHLTIVSHRIADTVRTRPRPTRSILTDGFDEERSLQSQRDRMAGFLKTKRFPGRAVS